MIRNIDSLELFRGNNKEFGDQEKSCLRALEVYHFCLQNTDAKSYFFPSKELAINLKKTSLRVGSPDSPHVKLNYHPPEDGLDPTLDSDVELRKNGYFSLFMNSGGEPSVDQIYRFDKWQQTIAHNFKKNGLPFKIRKVI